MANTDIILHGSKLSKDLGTENAAVAHAIADDAKITADLALSEVDLLGTELPNKEPKLADATIWDYLRGDRTWSNFTDDVKYTLLSGYNGTVSGVISATDNILGAFGKVQKQITDAVAAIATKASIDSKFITIDADSNLSNSRQIIGTTAELVITEDIPNKTVILSLAPNPIIPGTEAIRLPAGTTAERPVDVTANPLRINNELDIIEFFNRGKWRDVLDSTLLENNSDYTGFPNRTDTTISFNPANRTFTITSVNATFDVYFSGKRRKQTSFSYQIPDISKMHFIQMTPDGTVVAPAGPEFTNVLIAAIHWNAEQQKTLLFADERHSISMSPTEHQYLHTSLGTQYKSGLLAGNYSLTGTGNSNADAQLSISDGALWDEDLLITIADSATQQLSPFAQLPIWYRYGADGGWYKIEATDYPVATGNNRIKYNGFVSNTWDLIEASSNSSFIAMWIVATNDINEPIVAVMGQYGDSTIEEAIVNNTIGTFEWGIQPVAEYKILYRCIFETNSNFTNASKAILRTITDVRSVIVVTTNASVAATHSSMSGLDVDDHLQYLHNSSPRLITAVHTFNPSSQTSPFALGPNAVGQLISGLNADYLNGYQASQFVLSADYAVAIASKANTTDVNAALNGKEPSIANGTTAKFFRGDKSWQDLATAVRSAVLTGLSVATNSAVVAADSILVAIGKLQAQITAVLAYVDSAIITERSAVADLTNKTLIAPTIKNYTEFQYNANVSGAVTIDLANGTLQELILTANTTFTLPTSVSGKSYTLVIGYAGAFVPSFTGGSVLKWSGQAAPAAKSTAGFFDIFVFTCDGTNTFGRSGGSNF